MWHFVERKRQFSEGHPNGQTFAGILIDQCRQAELAAIVGLRLHEVVTPNMIAPIPSQPDAGSLENQLKRLGELESMLNVVAEERDDLTRKQSRSL